MNIYRSKQTGNTFGNAEPVVISDRPNMAKCTPYVTPDETYLIFAEIGDQLDLSVSLNDGKGQWTQTKRLHDEINHLGQGNPFVTPDGKFLLYTTGDHEGRHWKINWVQIEGELL